MPGWLKRWLPVAGGLTVLLLLAVSLRPLGFFWHYSSQIFHLRAGREESARISLFRAAHFNPTSTLLKRYRKKAIMDAVFFRAVREDDVDEIRDFTSVIFPFTSFRQRYAGYPWFQVLEKSGGGTLDWRRIGELGVRLLTDPSCSAMLLSHIDKAVVAPVSEWTSRLAVVAGLGGNDALASHLDPSQSWRGKVSEIQEGPKAHIDAAPVNGAEESDDFVRDPSCWKLRIHGKECAGLAGFSRTGGKAILLMAGPAACSSVVIAAFTAPDGDLLPASSSLRVDYLTDMDGATLELRSGRKIRLSLPSTRGRWERVVFSPGHHFGSLGKARFVLRGGGMVAVAGVSRVRDIGLRQND